MLMSELSWMEGDEREEDNLEILMGDGGRLDLMPLHEESDHLPCTFFRTC